MIIQFLTGMSHQAYSIILFIYIYVIYIYNIILLYIGASTHFPFSSYDWEGSPGDAQSSCLGWECRYLMDWMKPLGFQCLGPETLVDACIVDILCASMCLYSVQLSPIS